MANIENTIFNQTIDLYKNSDYTGLKTISGVALYQGSIQTIQDGSNHYHNLSQITFKSNNNIPDYLKYAKENSENPSKPLNYLTEFNIILNDFENEKFENAKYNLDLSATINNNVISYKNKIIIGNEEFTDDSIFKYDDSGSPANLSINLPYINEFNLTDNNKFREIYFKGNQNHLSTIFSELYYQYYISLTGKYLIESKNSSIDLLPKSSTIFDQYFELKSDRYNNYNFDNYGKINIYGNLKVEEIHSNNIEISNRDLGNPNKENPTLSFKSVNYSSTSNTSITLNQYFDSENNNLVFEVKTS